MMLGFDVRGETGVELMTEIVSRLRNAGETFLL
jgi:hypothetical protein